MSARPTFRNFGFSLIELLVGIVILGILASVAIPSFQSWVRNSHVRNVAESVTDGMQRARAEAVSRNTDVAFTLSTDTSWTVNVVTPNSGIASAPSSQGAMAVTPTISPASAVTGAGSAAITFNNLGGVNTNNADGTVPITAVDFTLTGANQPLRVTVNVGGSARLCDPNAPSGTTRACN